MTGGGGVLCGLRWLLVLSMTLGGCGSGASEGGTVATGETTAAGEEGDPALDEATATETTETTETTGPEQTSTEPPASAGDSTAAGDTSPPAGPRVPALCSEDTDCVLVAGDCSSPEAVDEPHARERARQNTQRLSVGECRGGDPVVPVRALCSAGACATTPSDHPEWRLCGETEECVIIPRRCGWDVVTVESESEARAAFRAEAPSCSRQRAPAAPRVACRYGFCAFDWREP